MYNSFKDISDMANFARTPGAKDKKQRKKWTIGGAINGVRQLKRKALGEQINKDGTRTLNKREHMTKGAILPGAAGLALGGAGAAYAKAMVSENQKDFLKHLPRTAIAGGLGGATLAGGIGAGLGYMSYRAKRKNIQDYTLNERDKKRVGVNRKISALKEQRKYV